MCKTHGYRVLRPFLEHIRDFFVMIVRYINVRLIIIIIIILNANSRLPIQAYDAMPSGHCLTLLVQVVSRLVF